MEGLVDFTGGVSEAVSLSAKEEEMLDASAIWASVLNFYQQKFLLGCINTVE